MDYNSEKKKKKKCIRTIHTSIYEHNDPSTRLWWYKIFDKLEGEFNIAPDERIDIVEDLFPEIKKRLAAILQFKEVDPERLANEKEDKEVAHSTGSYRHRYGSDESLETEYEEFDEEIRENNAGPTNPYMKFFKRRPDRAAIWQTLPPLKLSEMNLTQKAAAVTEMIAQSFYEWLKNIGGDEQPTLDTPTIIKMFEIGFNYHAAHSLCVRIKEMPAVTDAIAETRNLPQASVRVNLHKQLKHDLKAYKTKEKLVAFGKMLPLELRSRPPKEDFVKKWLQCKRVPRQLASMETVWGGIEGLRSTRAFCGWLIDHPDVPPPGYLEEKGMLDIEFLAAPHYSVEDVGEAAIELGGIGETIGTAVHNATAVPGPNVDPSKPADQSETAK